MSSRLPDHLFSAIEGRLDLVQVKTLRSGYADLSRQYRRQTVSEGDREDLDPAEGAPGGRSPGGFTRAQARALGYLAGRFPATYAAAQAALRQVPLEALAGANSVLDLGAGPGTATWALLERWPAIRQASFLESDPDMLEHARALGTAFEGLQVSLKSGDLRAQLQASQPHDVVVLAYVLSELAERDQEALLESVWAKAARGLFLLEPGTPETSRRVQAARRQLVALGGHLAAPCPQSGACPLLTAPKNAKGLVPWCHFSVRLERRGLHKMVKGGDLGYEDEKYSWLYVSRGPASPPPYRLHSDPHRRNRNLTLDVCDKDGRRQDLFFDRRKTPANVRQAARRLRWGDAWDPAAVPPMAGDDDDDDGD